MKKFLCAVKVLLKKRLEVTNQVLCIGVTAFNLRVCIYVCTYVSLFQVTLLWRRAVGDPDFTRIFCLVHAEKLSYQTSNNIVQSLLEVTQGERGM